MSIFHMDAQVEAKKRGEGEERILPSSPFAHGALHDACRVAGVAMKPENPVGPSPNMPPRGPGAPKHRRCMSDNLIARPKRTSSFQRWKIQMQKAWRWGGNAPEEEGAQSSFNPEILANQKRQWNQLHSRTPDEIRYKEPTNIFEHFIVAGLSPDANLEVVEDAFARRKKWEQDMERSEAMDYPPSRLPPPFPAMEPQILFKYPPGKKLGMRIKDLAAFCFPSGVKARLLERSPSLSELNELVYGQEHLGRDDFSFVFSLKVADNATLYGVCLHIPEIVQRCPGILGHSPPLSQSPDGCCRFLVSAPRCYCVLTRVPFFELHYELLHSIIAQERLNRITDFIREMSINEYVPRSRDHSPERGIYPDWTASAIPVNSAMALTAAAAGMITDDEIPSSSLKTPEPQSPESVTGSESSFFSLAREASVSDFAHIREASDLAHPREDHDHGHTREDHDHGQAREDHDHGQAREDHDHGQAREDQDHGQAREDQDHGHAREIDKDSAKNSHFDDCASEASESRSEIFERICGSCDNNVLASPETGLFPSRSSNLQRVGSTESLIFSPARSLMSDDEDEGNESNSSPNDIGDEFIMEWARETKNELLQIVCSYHAQPIPPRGSELVFKPLEHLQAIMYRRPPITSLVYNRKYLETFEPSEVNAKLAAAEEALALSLWTTATTCRALSLQSILALVTGVLLEKQVVIMCPNLGVLSATVLSIIPMILPFQWQSLLLPVLPMKMFEFLDAPVPFLVGMQNSSPDLKLKASNLVHVNVTKDQVKSCNLPALPRYRELYCELGPIHARLAAENHVAKRHPVNKCNQVQAQGAAHFLTVMRRYLESICQDLRAHTITSVQSNNDRVSILLKDSFVDSFPTWDRPFIKQFLDTQLFTVLSDTRLSSYENGYY